MASEPPAHDRFARRLLVIYALVWVVMAIRPRDWPTWALENLLVVFAIGILMATHRRFTFSNASYLLITIYLSLHAYGAHYGYANTPVGDWAKSVFHLDRNYFDRAIHCAFGLLLVYPMREVLLRTAGTGRPASGWLAGALVLGASSIFEVVESIVAEKVSPGTGPNWLGAQGDEWDAQKDMIMATAGAGFTLLVTWWSERGRFPKAPDLKPEVRPFGKRRVVHAMCAFYAVAWVIAAIHPVSRSDWLLENILVFVCMPVFVFTYRRRPLSDVSYLLILLFLLLHTAGAHYTYSEVPLGYWLKDAFGMARNHFDRIVHFSWGLLLTYPLRDLTRLSQLRPFWAAFLPATIIAASSGFFEIIEAVVVWLVNPELGQAYLGTQGDVWDGQWDMGLAMIGSAIACVFTVISERRRPAK